MCYQDPFPSRQDLPAGEDQAAPATMPSGADTPAPIPFPIPVDELFAEMAGDFHNVVTGLPVIIEMLDADPDKIGVAGTLAAIQLKLEPIMPELIKALDITCTPTPEPNDAA